LVAQSSGMAQILPGKVFKVNDRKKKKPPGRDVTVDRNMRQRLLDIYSRFFEVQPLFYVCSYVCIHISGKTKSRVC